MRKPPLVDEVSDRLGRIERLALRFGVFSPHAIAVFLWTSLAFLCLALFFRLGFSLQVGGMVHTLDEEILRYIGKSIRTPGLDFFFVDISSLGSLAIVVAISIVAVVLFLLARDPAAAIHLVIVAIGGFQIASWAKHLFDRPRPDIIPKLVQVGGKSFPSGHAVTASAIYLTLAILACRHFKGYRAQAVLFALAALMISAVAFSRLYLGVHYPSDVLSGAFLGSAWALTMGAIFSKQHFFKERK